MGRKSKLTDAQWAEVERRLLEGESRRALGREFKVSETSIREHFAGSEKEAKQVKEVARKIVDAERSLEALPPLARKTAQNLAEKLRSVSESLAAAAELGAKTSHRLMALANDQVNKVDDAEPLSEQSIASLKNVSALTKLGNDSATIALNLLSANKDTVKRLNEEGAEEEADVMTPERIAEGVRRIAFTLHKAATENT